MKHFIALIFSIFLLSGCTTIIQQANSPSSVYLQKHAIYLDHFSLYQNQIKLSATLQFTNPSQTLEKWTIYQIILYVDQKTYFLNDISIQNAEFPFDHWDGTLLPHENKKITLIGSATDSAGTYATAELFFKCQNQAFSIKIPETLVSSVY